MCITLEMSLATEVAGASGGVVGCFGDVMDRSGGVSGGARGTVVMGRSGLLFGCGEGLWRQLAPVLKRRDGYAGAQSTA